MYYYHSYSCSEQILQKRYLASIQKCIFCKEHVVLRTTPCIPIRFATACERGESLSQLSVILPINITPCWVLQLHSSSFINRTSKEIDIFFAILLPLLTECAHVLLCQFLTKVYEMYVIFTISSYHFNRKVII